VGSERPKLKARGGLQLQPEANHRESVFPTRGPVEMRAVGDKQRHVPHRERDFQGGCSDVAQSAIRARSSTAVSTCHNVEIFQVLRLQTLAVGTREPKVAKCAFRVGIGEPKIPRISCGVGAVEPKVPCVAPGVGSAEPQVPWISRGVGCAEPQVPRLSRGVGGAEPQVSRLSIGMRESCEPDFESKASLLGVDQLISPRDKARRELWNSRQAS